MLGRAAASRRVFSRTTSSAIAAMPSSSAPPKRLHTLASLPKTWRFTAALPPDPAYPTPAASHAADRDSIGPRLVRGALFTWVRPESQDDPELLAVSPAALRDLGLDPAEAATEDFRQTAAGNKLWGWDEAAGEGGYPWAQCYGGFQFGQWAGQLGDGRAISLFEANVAAPAQDGGGAAGQTPSKSYEIQLKGAGVTPYSRFADGLAVLRSSLREFVASETLHALGIPSTRALALTHLPKVLVHRERLEPGAIVVRFAETWLRLGTFDLLRVRGDRLLTQRLATYAAESVFGGWSALPGAVARPATDVAAVLAPPRGLGPDVVETVPSSNTTAAESDESDKSGGGSGGGDVPATVDENRFARLFREVVRRNAATVARWQVYGFTNGVLNTDNTSLYGLSLDFGPFAFLDHFDPAYTPNHDDHALRYSYRNQPSIIWWNLVRFGEALAELLAAGARVDDPAFAAGGIVGLARVDVGEPEPAPAPSGDAAATTDKPVVSPAVEKAAAALATRAESIILRAGDEYKVLFLAEYRRLFLSRLGLPTTAATDPADPTDMDPLITSLLDVLQQLELDFHLFFRRLSSVSLADVATDSARLATAARFFYRQGLPATAPAAALPGRGEDAARRQIADWLAQWHDRILASADLVDDHKRSVHMKSVNPNFIPRGWILDEVIQRVEHDGERDVLRRIIHMATHPFADAWHGHTFDGQLYEGDSQEETRWTEDVPETKRAMQCSCSS